MRKVQTRVLVEVNEITRLRRRYCVTGFCEGCAREVRMLSPASAADLISVDTARILFLMSTRKIHSRSGDEGQRLVCLPSLSVV